eukprot:868282-Prymnesium_polylepis.1
MGERDGRVGWNRAPRVTVALRLAAETEAGDLRVGAASCAQADGHLVIAPLVVEPQRAVLHRLEASVLVPEHQLGCR